MPVEHRDPGLCLIEIDGVARRLVQGERGAAEIGVVVDARANCGEGDRPRRSSCRG